MVLGGGVFICFAGIVLQEVLPTDHLYPMINHFYPNGRGLFQDDPLPHPHLTIGLNGLRRMKMRSVIRDGLHTPHISIQLNYRVTRQTVFSNTIIVTPTEGRSFGRIERIFHRASTDPESCRIDAKVQWSCFDGLWWINALLLRFTLGFPVILSMLKYITSSISSIIINSSFYQTFRQLRAYFLSSLVSFSF